MKSADQIAKDIISLLKDSEVGDTSLVMAKVKNLIQTELDADKVRCNQCAKILDKEGEDRWGSTEVEINWGYHSTGKDTDHDNWNLCKGCTKTVIECHSLICNVCKRTIPEVMAEISARNPHSSFYGDPAAALMHHSNKGDFSGEAYAQVNDRIICELCYDDLTAKFKIPIGNVNYMIATGDLYQNDHHPRINRVAQALAYAHRQDDTGDSLRAMYHSNVNYEDAVAIRKDSNRSQFLIEARVDIYRERYFDRFQNEVTLTTGDNQYYTIPCSWFDPKLPGLDFTKPAILNGGRTLALGSYHLEMSQILLTFKPRTEE